MKKMAPYLRLISDFINSALLIVVILKKDYTITILFVVIIALVLRIFADIYE